MSYPAGARTCRRREAMYPNWQRATVESRISVSSSLIIATLDSDDSTWYTVSNKTKYGSLMKLANMCALEAYDFGLPGSSPGRATMCGKVEYSVLCKTSKGSNDQTTQKRKSVVHLKHHRNYTEIL